MVESKTNFVKLPEGYNEKINRMQVDALAGNYSKVIQDFLDFEKENEGNDSELSSTYDLITSYVSVAVFNKLRRESENTTSFEKFLKSVGEISCEVYTLIGGGPENKVSKLQRKDIESGVKTMISNYMKIYFEKDSNYEHNEENFDKVLSSICVLDGMKTEINEVFGDIGYQKIE